MPAPQVDEMEVPGAFELPQAARYAAAETGRFDAVSPRLCHSRRDAALRYISSAVAQGILEASAHTGVPIAFGVLTTDS